MTALCQDRVLVQQWDSTTTPTTTKESRALSVLESSGVVQQMFGKKLDKKLAVEEFLTLVRKLRWEVRRVEFQQYLRGGSGGRSRDEAVRLDDVRRMLGFSEPATVKVRKKIAGFPGRATPNCLI